MLTAAIGFSAAGAADPAAVPTSRPAAATTSTAPAASDQELGSLAELAQYVKATEAQRTLLKAKAAQTAKAVQDFVGALGAQNQQWTAEARAAENDPEKQKAAQEKMAEVQAKWDQMLAERQADVMSVLTPGQRLAWEEHCLTEAMTARVAGMTIRRDAAGQPVAQKGELTPRQTRMIEDACKATAKSILALDNPYDPKGRQELVAKLEADIRQKMQAGGIMGTTRPGTTQPG
jgi:hypothetical protein